MPGDETCAICGKEAGRRVSARTRTVADVISAMRSSCGQSVSRTEPDPAARHDARSAAKPIDDALVAWVQLGLPHPQGPLLLLPPKNLPILSMRLGSD